MMTIPEQGACGGRVMRLYSRPSPVVHAAGAPVHPNESCIGRRSAALENCGAIAQLGERFNGIEEVVGSIPSGSTKHSP